MRMWMKAIAVSIGAWASVVMGLVVMSLLAFGFWPGIYPGFAQASEVRSQQATLDQLLTGQKIAQVHALITELDLTRKAMCEAAAANPKNVTAFQYSAQRLRELQQQYTDLTDRYYTVPACEQLVIAVP